MKIKLLATVAVLAMTGAASAEVIFAHGANPGNPRYIAAEKWVDLFAACSGEEVNHAPAATMGNDAEMLTSAQSGVIQVSANSQGAMSQIVPEVGLLGLPFLFSDLPTAWAVVDGDVGDMIDERAQNAGLKVLGFWDNGIRNITHTGKHVSSPEDVAGMKIRTPPDPMTLAIFEALGANPAPLAWSELPSALQSGVFEGQENPLVNIHSAKLHDITPYVTMTGHKYESTPVVASMAWWAGLDEAKQDCAVSATAEAGEIQRGLSLKGDATLRPRMAEDGALFAEADKAAYIAATASVYDQYAADYPELVAALKAAAGLE